MQAIRVESRRHGARIGHGARSENEFRAVPMQQLGRFKWSQMPKDARIGGKAARISMALSKDARDDPPAQFIVEAATNPRCCCKVA